MKNIWIQYVFEISVILGCAISLLMLCRMVSSDDFVNDHSVSSIVWQPEFVAPPAVCTQYMCIDMANIIYLPDTKEVK